MPRPRPREAPAEGGGPRAGLRRLTSEEFAARFEGSARVLWTLAAGVLGSRSQVEDVLQEAALIGLQRLDQFVPGTSFPAWMGRIVRLVALNQMRLQRRRKTHPADPDTLDRRPARAAADAYALDPVGYPRGDLPSDGGPFDDDLASALGELKPTARACLLLKAVMEMEYREIGETLGIPVGTAMSHVHRARRYLRRRLAGISPTGNVRVARES